MAVITNYTVYDIIKMSLKDCGALGVGQTPLSEDVNDAFTKLQWLLSEWQRNRWLIWHLVSTGYTPTGNEAVDAGGVPFYSVGPGGNYPLSPRPDKIESAFVRQINSTGLPIDYPLKVLQAMEDYSVIALKSMVSFPRSVFYDTAWPTGKLYAYPVPMPHIYEVFIQTKEILTQFTGVNQVIALPPEYYSALHWNLTVELCPGYGLEPTRTMVTRAKVTLNVLRKANTQIARLKMPGNLAKPGIYNPYSDQVQ